MGTLHFTLPTARGSVLPANKPPSIKRHDSPYRLDYAEWPSALQKAVGRPQRAGDGEAQNPPRRAILHRVADQHGGDGKEAEGCEGVHFGFGAASLSLLPHFGFGGFTLGIRDLAKNPVEILGLPGGPAFASNLDESRRLRAVIQA